MYWYAVTNDKKDDVHKNKIPRKFKSKLNSSIVDGIKIIIEIIWTVVFTFDKKVTFKTFPLINSL